MAARILGRHGDRRRDPRRTQAARGGASRPASGARPGWASSSPATIPASEIYVRNKLKTAGDGRHPRGADPRRGRGPVDDVLAIVDGANAAGRHRRHPRPVAAAGGMGDDAETRVIDAIDPTKDVDGFTPVNVGLLVQNRPGLVACTPSGVIEMLDRCRHRHQGRAGRRHRAQRHRRQADGAAAAAPPRHGHHLPLAHQGPAGRRAHAPTSWWRPSGGRRS